MKYSEGDQPNREMFEAYIKESAQIANASVTETRDRILGYLFILNAGGIVAGVAYQNAQQAINPLITKAIILFGIGLFAAVLRATGDYFACQFGSNRFFRNLRAFRANELEWTEFVARREKPIRQSPYYALGIFSGVCFFVGLIIGLIGFHNGMTHSSPMDHKLMPLVERSVIQDSGINESSNGKKVQLWGLILNMIGTALVWRFGLPAKDINRSGNNSLLISQGDPAMIVLATRYDCAANAGMLLIFVGFVLQAVALF